MASSSTAYVGGSSPRGRGTRRAWRRRAHRHRFIPARAGNTGHQVSGPCRDPVHPRAGGEHRHAGVAHDARVGSSPRGRGTLGELRRDVRQLRFIPARAGNTFVYGFDTNYPSGSSPRGRGTHARLVLSLAPRRFIPARAGNTCSPCPLPCAPAVHPRAGGEHMLALSLSLAPRRFIPARAGNTEPCESAFVTDAVHPRAGGEHCSNRPYAAVPYGSSPRGRGTPEPPPLALGERGFIPARAGNTFQPSCAP